jgi:hypothetical protein
MIPFPKIHIAASVLNRIANTLEGEPQFVTPQYSPLPPTDPSALGQQIDNAVSDPPMPSEPPPGTQQQTNAAMEAASAEGGSPFDGALMGASPSAY